MPRGGNHGGGSTIRRVELTEAAARELRLRITGDYASRYTKEQASGAASAHYEQLSRHEWLYLTDDMAAALPYLELARDQCFSDQAQRGLDQLIAALWAKSAAHPAD